MLWHVVFGIEDGIEGLISPSHLVLAFGGGLMVTGPLRAGLAHPAPAERPWLARMPMVVSLTIFLSLVTFFTEYASPYATTWVTERHRVGGEVRPVGGALGLPGPARGADGAPLVRPAATGAARRGLTVLLSVNVALMTIIHDKFSIRARIR